MSNFWIILAAISAAVIAALVPASLRLRNRDTELGDAQNLHAQRLEELHDDAAEHLIDESQLALAEEEITRALLKETQSLNASTERDNARVIARWPTTIFIACAIPAIAFWTYFELGTPELVDAQSVVADATGELDQKTIDDMLATLKARLENDAQSSEGWLLLGRSNMALGRYDEAVNAFEKAYALLGDEPQIMLQYADALAMAAGGDIEPKTRELVERIIELEPENVAALWLAGLGAGRAGDLQTALTYFQRARGAAAKNGTPTHELDAIISGLTSEGIENASDESNEVPNDNDAPALASVRVSLELAPELTAQVQANDSLFVFARAAGTDSGPPLAVTRSKAESLPGDFVLDESMAMAPMFKMKLGDSVEVTARLSRSGTPGAQSGDLQGKSTAFVVGQSKEISIVIDTIVE